MADQQPTLARYVATDSRGTARGGVVPSGVLNAWVEARWRAGWRRLRVTVGEDLVGEIAPAYDDPTRRTWWAEAMVLHAG